MEENEIKQTLLKEISKTEDTIREYRELTKPIAPDCAIGRVSRMDAIINILNPFRISGILTKYFFLLQLTNNQALLVPHTGA